MADKTRRPAPVKVNEKLAGSGWIEEQTQGFVKLKPEEYRQLERGDFVKYVNAKGEFVAGGGYVLATEYDDRDDSFYWKLGSGLNSRRTWKVYHARTQQVWKKISRPLEVTRIMSDVSENREQIQEIMRFLIRKFPELDS